MQELLSLVLTPWVGGAVLAAAAGLWAWRRGRLHRQGFGALAQRLNLQLGEDGQAVSGLLAGRNVRAWAEPGEAGGATCVQVELLGVLPATEHLPPQLLCAWAAAVEARERGGLSALGAEVREQLQRLSPRVAALLEDAPLQALLLAAVRANERTWIERGQLHVSRRVPLRRASVLEAFVEEALALAVALSSAMHGPRRLGRAG